jgi:hypothetical protein
MSCTQSAHKVWLQGGKYCLTLFGSEVSNTYQSGDHYYETDMIVTHYEGLGWINVGRLGENILFRFWAPRSRLSHRDQSLERAVFGFEGAVHYEKLALDMVASKRHVELLDWLIERIFAEMNDNQRKGIDNTVFLGNLPYKEFVTAFCSETIIA